MNYKRNKEYESYAHKTHTKTFKDFFVDIHFYLVSKQKRPIIMSTASRLKIKTTSAGIRLLGSEVVLKADATTARGAHILISSDVGGRE